MGATNFTPNCHFEYRTQQASYFILSNCHFLFVVTTIEIKIIENLFAFEQNSLFLLFAAKKMTDFESFSEDLIPRTLPQPTLHPVLVS